MITMQPDLYAFEAYLFDIDGTLLHCSDAVHYFAFCDALSSAAGRPMTLDGVTAHGNTDIGILRDAFLRAGLSPEGWQPRIAEICDQMCCQVEENRAELCVQVLPGVRDILEHLQAKGALLAVATGNLERIGRQKLRAADLDRYFEIFAWSDGLEYREDVYRSGVAKIRADLGGRASILAFGDTPADVRSARTCGIPIIAVASGIYTYEELIAETPSLCVRTFRELFDVTASTIRSNSSAR